MKNEITVNITSDNLLRRVADVAAFCMIDLNANLNTAYEEFLSGKISNGAFQYVCARHGMLLNALRAAGYTDNHPFFKYPTIPKSPPQKTNHEKTQHKDSCAFLQDVRDGFDHIRDCNCGAYPGTEGASEVSISTL